MSDPLTPTPPNSSRRWWPSPTCCRNSGQRPLVLCCRYEKVLFLSQCRLRPKSLGGDRGQIQVLVSVGSRTLWGPAADKLSLTLLRLHCKNITFMCGPGHSWVISVLLREIFGPHQVNGSEHHCHFPISSSLYCELYLDGGGLERFAVGCADCSDRLPHSPRSVSETR